MIKVQWQDDGSALLVGEPGDAIQPGRNGERYRQRMLITADEARHLSTDLMQARHTAWEIERARQSIEIDEYRAWVRRERSQDGPIARSIALMDEYRRQGECAEPFVFRMASREWAELRDRLIAAGIHFGTLSGHPEEAVGSFLGCAVCIKEG